MGGSSYLQSKGQKRLALRTASFTMAFKPCVTLALLMGIAAVTRGEECSDGECGSEENSLLALRTVSEHNESSDEASRRRKPPVHCRNPDGTKFNCAGGDRAVAAHVWARATSAARM